MEINAQQTNQLIIVNKNKDIIPTTNGIYIKLTNLSCKITREKQSFKQQLDELNKEKNVDIRRKWWGATDLDSIRKAFSEVYADCRNYTTRCSDAILSVNDNMSNILELIQLLATVEVDIYHMVDDQSIANNELRELIKEWCKEHGIKDEEIEKLLTSSVQRAYTLRDRIENLRKDCDQKIGQNTEEIQQLCEKQKEIEKKNEDFIVKGQQDFERLDKEVQKKYEGFQKEQAEKLLEIKQSLESRAEELKKASEVLAEKQDTFIVKSQQKIASALEELDIKQKENSEALRKEQKERLLEMKQTLDANTEDLKKDSTALQEKQDIFIMKSKQEIASAHEKLEIKQQEAFESLRKAHEEQLSEIRRQYAEDTKRIDEIIEQNTKSEQTFINEQTSLVTTLKKQITNYKIISVCATGVSIATIIYTILT